MGSGPQLGGGDFFGLFMSVTPALTLVGDLQLGYGFTTYYSDCCSTTSYGYARITPDSYTFTRVTSVPEPTTLSLLVAGLLLGGAGARRRRVQR